MASRSRDRARHSSTTATMIVASLAAGNTIAATNASAFLAPLAGLHTESNRLLADLVDLVDSLRREVALLRAQANDNAADAHDDAEAIRRQVAKIP